MKRSDMVTLIQNSISVYLNDCYSKETATQIASTVLDNIEKSGMKPPEHPTQMREIVCGTKGFIDVEVYEWEPEDD